MTFLQPSVLWGLPLILVPVLIHLINRMRHRPQPWAAMQFLVFATRRSMSHAKLRQFLVLLFRVLTVLMLVVFLGRPLAGGWLGWALAPAPDAILILLDRSASMETQLAGTTTTRREQALQFIAQAARQFTGATHLILIDSALRAPQEIAGAAHLAGLPLTGPTDTAADLPAMMQSAVNWLIDNRAGTAEIWIASDLQRSNWQPEDSRWKTVIARLESLPQKVRVRLLALNQPGAANVSLSLADVVRRQRGDQSELRLVLDLHRSGPEPGPGKSETLPLTFTLDGTKTQVELSLDTPVLRWRHTVPLGTKKTGGWGSLALPADANGRDNIAYFVYGPETPLRASVISADPIAGRSFQLAAAALTAGGARQPAENLPARELPDASWAADTLLVWQEALPSGPLADRLRGFVEEGGVVIFFPTGGAAPQRFDGIGWGEVQAADSDTGFRIMRWDEEQGPLAKTDEGLSLALTQVNFHRRQRIVGQKNVLAAFADGMPFLARQRLGRGEFFFCASLPDPAWSSLGDGPVLVPLLQRLLEAGGRRLQQTAAVTCGELSAADLARRWEPADPSAGRDVRVQAGVYRSGSRWLAVNRPVLEDDTAALEVEQARRLFGTLPFNSLTERSQATASLQGEIWRSFLLAMLTFLVVEAILIRPSKAPAGAAASDRIARPPAVVGMGEAA